MQRPQQIAWLMQEGVHYTRKVVDEAVREYGVTVSQWAVLYRLALHPGLSGAELAREMLFTPQATHQALTTLVRMGLVERKPDPKHARIFRASLTEEGRQLAERCRAASRKIHEGLMATFDAEEQRVFADLLERYIGAVSGLD